MSKAFNDHKQAGEVYALSEEHITNKFDFGMKEVVAISYSI